MNTPRTCRHCNTPLSKTHPHLKFCNASCKQKEYFKRQVEIAALAYLREHPDEITSRLINAAIQSATTPLLATIHNLQHRIEQIREVSQHAAR